MDLFHWNQKLYPKSNGGEESFSYGRVDGLPFLAYISDSRAFVMNGELHLLQELDQPEGISGPAGTIAVSPSDGKIAVSYGAKVAIFSLLYHLDENGRRRSKWKENGIIEHDSVVNALSWNPAGGKLLTGSKGLKLWKANSSHGWKLNWSSTAASEIWRVKFSPDGRLFASLGKNDRNIKVWYKTEKELADLFGEVHQFQFLYISHPRAVTQFSWRNPQASSRSFNKNVLLTTCLDRVCRVWSETSFEESIGFYVCCFVEPSQSAATNDSMNTYIPGTINWVDARELRTAINIPSNDVNDLAPFPDHRDRAFSSHLPYALRTNALYQGQNERSGSFEGVMKDIPEILQNGTDLVVKIQQDGSLIFWGIQHLCEEPRRIPKVFPILRVTNAIPIDPRFFNTNLIVFHPSSHVRDGTPFPPHLTVLCQKVDGSMTGLGLNICETFSNPREACELTNKGTLAGPRGNVKQIYVHPNDAHPYVATISVAGELDIWFKNPHLFLTSRRHIHLQSCLSVARTEKHPFSHFSWIPNHKMFVTYNGVEIGLYELVSSELGVRKFHPNTVVKLGTCLDFNPQVSPLISLSTFLEQRVESALHEALTDDPESSQDVKMATVLILGVAKEGPTSTLLWRLTEGTTLGEKVGERIPGGDQDLEGTTGSRVVSSGPVPMLAGLSSSPFALIYTGHEDRTVRYWHMNSHTWAASIEDPSVPFWNQVSCKELSEVPTGIKCAPHSIAGASYKSSVVIFDVSDVNHEFILDCGAPVRSYDWMTSSTGILLLAVATKTGISMYSKKKGSATNSEAIGWNRVSFFPGDYDLVKWFGKDGTLLVSKDSTVIVLNKWVHSSSILYQQAPEASKDRKEWIWDYLSLAAAGNDPLPDYDPRSLRENLLWGNFTRVNQILEHLQSVLQPLKDSEIKDLHVIPPMSLNKLLKPEPAQAGTAVEGVGAAYNDLFDAPVMGIDDEAPVTGGSKTPAGYLGERLTSMSLPGITKKDQVILLAVIDTLNQLEAQKRALDENGVRYLLSLRLFFFLSHSLPLPQRPKSLDYNEIIWALHSESQDILLDNCMSAVGSPNSFTWVHMKTMGMGLWIKNVETLKKMVETVARNLFMSHEDKDPVACALFYLALNKKNVWTGLWRTAKTHVEHIKMTNFLANNFNEPRWKQAALKNAFQLLGLQRFEYAASFFLLSGSLKDAVNVCVKNLNDIQLAVVLCRVYEGDSSPLLVDLLQKGVLPGAIEQGNRWLASIAFWHLNQREKALKVIVEPLSNFQSSSGTHSTPLGSRTSSLSLALSEQMIDSAQLVFFEWFKKQPTFKLLLPSLQKHETEIFLKIAKAYERSGHLVLSLDVLHLWKDLMKVQLEEKAKALVAEREAPKPAPKKDTASALFDNDDDMGSSSSFGFGGGHNSITGRGGDGLFDNSDDLDWGKPSGGLGLDDDPFGDTGFKLNLFSAPPKPAPVVVEIEEEEASADGTATEGSKEKVAERNPLQDALKEVLPEFLQREGLLKEELTLVAMKLLTTVMKGSAVLDSGVFSNLLTSKPEFAYNLEQWIEGLSEKTSIKVSTLNQLMGEHCAHLENLRIYGELLMKSMNTSDAAGILFDTMLFKSRTLMTLLFGHKLESLREHHDELTEVHYFSFLWNSSRDLSGCFLKWKTELRDVVEKNPFHQQWKLLEVVWSIAVTNSICALEERRYHSLAEWMRQLSSLLIGYGRNKREIVLLLQKILIESEKLTQPSEEELKFVTIDDDGHRNSGDGSDDEGIEIRVKPQSESPQSISFRKKFSLQLLQLSLTRLLIVLIDACVNITDQKTQEGTSTPISVGIFSGLIKLANSLERSVAYNAREVEALGIGRTILSVFRTNEEKNLWASLQEIHNDAAASLSPYSSLIGLMQILEEPSKPSTPSPLGTPLRPSTPTPIGLTVPSATGKPPPKSNSMNSLPAANTQPHPDDNPTEWLLLPENVHRRNASQTSLATPVTSVLDTHPNTVCQINDMIIDFCVNRTNPDCMAITNGKRIWEFEVSKTSVANIVEENPNARDPNEFDDDVGTVVHEGHLGVVNYSKSADELPQSRPSSVIIDSRKPADTPLRNSLNDPKLDSSPISTIRTFGCQSLESHPSLPFYLSGGVEGQVVLWQFGHSQPFVTFRSKDNTRVNRIRFNSFGTKFTAIDAKGSMELWNFDVSHDINRSYQKTQCHSKSGSDVVFLSSGSLLATAGLSNSKKNVSLWDALMPTNKSRIKGFQTHDGGATSLAYSQNSQVLFSGGRRGDISLYDIRQCKVINTFTAHSKNVRSLYIDEARNFLYSGSADGDIKVWNLSTLECLDVWKNVHHKNTFLRASFDRSPVAIYGVMNLDASPQWMISGGADGSLKRRRHPLYYTYGN